jgi:hypothetical protein
VLLNKAHEFPTSLFPDVSPRHSQHLWSLYPCAWFDDALPSMSTENAKHAREARLPKAAEVATAEGGHAQPPQKKKQKRNKPTLSCEECVERKTKVC